MKILLAGDSTVAACPSYEYPMSGWGAQLPQRVYWWAAVHNYAKGGATTESFREEGLWYQLLHQAVKGDLVLIQFGHNDQKRAHLSARGGYADNLGRMVAEVRSKGAVPILCTSAERRHFEGGVLKETLAEYASTVRELGRELDVDVVDLNAWTRSLYLGLGEEESKQLFFHFAPGAHAHWAGGLQDDTHFHEEGARRIAAHVAEQLDVLGYKPEPDFAETLA
ncbi:rhamnogalacturonan acetylesterase [Arthrobacter sp. M4]|uniref:rhamnogalacturonan acetylesterase n=1 Tax=Arthrobacter sp. M4 TaxID=218160 RepID=UPI001CDD4618|nr:rhamnogalacturonan acetylesterase [Arthrobacter sp. M4]MCA4135099.1 rhamnogalacturonan acetylesterase [Arthrobacter sp. M4]